MTRRNPGQVIHELMVGMSDGGEPGTNALELMHEAGLTLPEVVALNRLHHERRPLTIGELSSHCGLSMSATSALVQRMVDDGFVSREEAPDDRRQKQVRLTRAGDAIIGRIAAAQVDAMNRNLAALPAPLRTELLDVAHRVLEHVRAAGGPAARRPS